MPRTAHSSAPQQPTGRLVFSDPSTYNELSRQQRAGQALRLAPGVYALNATLPATAVTAHHLWAIVAHFWPGAVICDRSALEGLLPGDMAWPEGLYLSGSARGLIVPARRRPEQRGRAPRALS